MPLQVVGLLTEGDRTMGHLWPLQVGFNQGQLWASGYVKGLHHASIHLKTDTLNVCTRIQSASSNNI